MTTSVAERHGSALRIVREQLGAATAATQCHGCGCFQQTVTALAAVDSARGELLQALEEARRVFVPKKYDCLGCAVCFPAVAANAIGDAFPELAGTLDLCPTEAPSVRDGWPPLPGDFQVLRYGAAVAVCTLDDEALSDELARLAPQGLAIVGTMRTENLGIERLIQNILANPHIRILVLSGGDTERAVGHLPGQSLESLFANGVDAQGRIRGARGKRPVLKNVRPPEVEAFLRQVELVSLVGEADARAIASRVEDCAQRAPDPIEESVCAAHVPIIAAAVRRRLVPDPAGYFVIYPDAGKRALRVEHFSNDGVLGCLLEGQSPAALYSEIVDRKLISRLDHAAYLGRELARAERALESGERYVQDRAAGEADDVEATVPTACGCKGPCGPGGAP